MAAGTAGALGAGGVHLARENLAPVHRGLPAACVGGSPGPTGGTAGPRQPQPFPGEPRAGSKSRVRLAVWKTRAPWMPAAGGDRRHRVKGEKPGEECGENGP